MGNNKPKEVMIWKVPETLNTVHDVESINLCHQIENELPLYHTRAMISKATRQWTWLKKISNVSLITLYKTSSGDANKISDSESMNILLDKLNNGDNIGDISDIMTSLYKDQEGKFDNF